MNTARRNDLLPSAGLSAWDRAQPRRALSEVHASVSALPLQTLADASSTIRVVQPQYAAQVARANAWDCARKPALTRGASEATTGMSELPTRIAAELRARKVG